MTGPLSIRRAACGDADAVHALTRRAYAKWVGALGREPLPMTTDHRRAVRDDRVDMAFESGRLVALVHVVDRPGDLLVENLAVDPDCQGRGLGDALLAHAERVGADAGKPAVRLYTNALMTGNTAFYEARGYRREREEPFGNGVRVHLVKMLSAGADG